MGKSLDQNCSWVIESSLIWEDKKTKYWNGLIHTFGTKFSWVLWHCLLWRGHKIGLALCHGNRYPKMHLSDAYTFMKYIKFHIDTQKIAATKRSKAFWRKFAFSWPCCNKATYAVAQVQLYTYVVGIFQPSMCRSEMWFSYSCRVMSDGVGKVVSDIARWITCVLSGFAVTNSFFLEPACGLSVYRPFFFASYREVADFHEPLIRFAAFPTNDLNKPLFMSQPLLVWCSPPPSTAPPPSL